MRGAASQQTGRLACSCFLVRLPSVCSVSETFEQQREDLDECGDDNRYLDTPGGELHVFVEFSCHDHLGMSQTKLPQLLCLPLSDSRHLTVPLTFPLCESESN